MSEITPSSTRTILVVPCYNEQEILKESSQQLSEVLNELIEKGLATDGFILFVDDGSSDGTWQIIKNITSANASTIGIKLAHNQGHQNAVWAGMEYAAKQLNADYIISIDADLQDDIHVIPEMAELFRQGKEIVLGVRRNRTTDTFFKRQTALAFYKMMQSLGCEIQYNHADFRLMGRKSVLELLSYPERNLFLRGMVKSLGYSTANVYYNRLERTAGESKYPLKKMISFALDGITSFSVKPLRIIVLVGLVFVLISLIAIIYGLSSYISGKALPGWTSLLISLWFIGGFILTSLGVIGEYIGKIYKEVKRRPRFIIEETTKSLTDDLTTNS